MLALALAFIAGLTVGGVVIFLIGTEPDGYEDAGESCFGALAHCPDCDLWLEPDQACPHIQVAHDPRNERADALGSAGSAPFHASEVRDG